MRLAGSAALLLLLQPLSRAAAAVTTISNTAIRRDQYGTPLNAHQGSMLQGHGPHAGTYYYYGGHTANCTHGAPPLHCESVVDELRDASSRPTGARWGRRR